MFSPANLLDNTEEIKFNTIKAKNTIII